MSGMAGKIWAGWMALRAPRAEENGAGGGSGGRSGSRPSPEAAAEAARDHELVRQFQNGNEGAFTELVTRHRSRLYGMVRNMVQNDADAWDLTQEIFVKIWKALPRFEANAQFSTWTYRVAHNAVYDWLRKRKIRPEHELDESLVRSSSIAPGATTAPGEATPPDEALGQLELRGRLAQAMDQLSENHRTAILLKEVQGLKYREIAEVMGCSIGTVMSRIFHARQQLQGLLADER